MRELELLGVRVSLPDHDVVVVLVERTSARALPIVIGPREGAAIAAAQAGLISERPQTHDLMLTILQRSGTRLRAVQITRLEQGTFFAELVLSGGECIDARPSDAIALAVRVGCAVECDEDVLDRAAVPWDRGADEEEPELVERFRHFLDEVEPEDFGHLDPPPSSSG